MGNEMKEIKHELAVMESKPLSIFENAAMFKEAWNIASCLAKSDFIPKAYKGKPENVVIALELSQRIETSALAVMQSLNVINGSPSWSATFIIAALNSSGRFSPLRYDMQGDEGKENRSCAAWAYELNTKEKLISPRVSMEMAKKEGWIDKNGSKWKTMPEVMLRYRAASFFGKLYAPDILNGMGTKEEIEDAGQAVDIVDAEEQLKEEISREANKQIIDVGQDTVDTQTGEILGEEASKTEKTGPKMQREGSTEEKLPPF